MKTTFGRTFSSAVILLLMVMLIVGASFRLLVKDYLMDNTLEGLKNDSSTIAALASAYYAEDAMSSGSFLINLTVASQVSGADAVICNHLGQVVLCSDSPLGCEHQGRRINQDYLQRILANGGDTDSLILEGLYDEARYVVSTPITDPFSNTDIGVVIVSTPMAETMAVLGRISDIFMFVALLVIGVACVAMSIFARRQSFPLREVAKTASAFGHGDLTARVHINDSYTEEVEELALAFNNMASSLQKSEYQRQEFVANVSHELKTPMTTIGGYIDGILDGTIPPEKHRHYMQIVSDEIKRLSRLVRSMLDISRLQDQGGIPEEKKTQFDLEECAGQVLITFEQKINDKKLNVDVDMPSHPVITHACEDYVTQVIYNLIDNAVKFCPEGGSLGLRIREGGNKAYVSISNDGSTIPPEELPLVFDRFHKIDKSRSQNRDGWGLGLYIVKTIVCSHGENISVTSRDGNTEFTFTMPLIQ